MLYFLDGGGAGLFYVVIGIGIFFIALAILVEALVMLLMKYHIFKRAMRDSTIVNIFSLILGFALLSAEWEIFSIDSWKGFLAIFFATVLIEGLVLYLMNKDKPIGKTVLVTVIMNVVTYFILYFFTDLT